MKDLRLTLIQSNLHWEDSAGNLKHFRKIFSSITKPTDLILLPETFNTGFSINPALCAEDMNGPSVQFLKEMAERTQAAIMATLIVRDGNDHFNRMVCAHPGGDLQTYDKRHLFRLSEEYRIFEAGKQKPFFNVKGWNIQPVICYDLRFPVWIKNTYSAGQYGYDLLVCLANWPSSRAHIWKTLLMARAIENQVYVAGVNRIGIDGHGTAHTGDSMVIDAKGKALSQAEAGKECVISVTLPAQELKIFRESMTVGLDWDHFTLDLNI